MSSDDAKSFRERLRILRESKGLTQSQLEEKIGRERNYITRVETGRIDTPPLDGISKIAEGLEVSMGDLFFLEGIDDNADVLRTRINALVKTSDVKQLRKYYRLMLVSREE
jgi:transcriptional regulator with XRE-family HTH domain